MKHLTLMLVALSAVAPLEARAQPAQLSPQVHPQLSHVALFSRFARENMQDEALDLARLEAGGAPSEWQAFAPDAFAVQVNADTNRRPQNETSIAVRLSGGVVRSIVGANDYGIGVPIGGGVYTLSGTTPLTTYFPPFPLLFARGAGAGAQSLTEPPVGTGDPSVAYGRTREVKDASGNVLVPRGLPIAYYASLMFSSTFCENGIMVSTSFSDGSRWSRPLVPGISAAVPRGIGVPVYWDKGQNCTVLHDKEWIAVDSSGGPHDGRLYVTWTRFVFASKVFKEALILMVWSDDNGRTFTDPVVVSGFSPELCGGVCERNQASTPVVLPDGRVATAFLNRNGAGAPMGRHQYLVTIYDPDAATLSGPFKAADLFDGFDDYPLSRTTHRQTLCNANFRVWSAGNLAVDAAGNLYLTYSDDFKQRGQFPFPTFTEATVDPKTGAFLGYLCPEVSPGVRSTTDTDVYVLKGTVTSSGISWKDVTPAAARGANDQWFPWVATGPSGRVSAVFFDRSNDAANHLAGTTLVRSSSGASGWMAAAQVSDFLSNFDDAFFGEGSFIGDYNGLAIDALGASHPTWTGVRPGRVDSDVFTTTVGP